MQLPNTTIISNNLSEEIKDLKKGMGKDMAIFGSPSVAHALMADNLIDDYWLFINPIILGKGIRLFKETGHPIHLRLLTSKAFPSGVTYLHYEAKRNK